MRKCFRAIYDHFEGILLCMITALLVADVLLGIVARLPWLHFETVFATEVGKYLFIWLSLIGVSAAAKDHQHVRLDVLGAWFPVSRKLIWITSQILFLTFSLFFLIWGAHLTWTDISMERSTMGFQFPMFLFRSALPIGFGLTSLRLIEDIVRSFVGSSKNPPWEAAPSGGLGGISDEV